MASYLILGRGYTGKVLEKLLLSRGHQVTCTSRSDPAAVRFVIEDDETWAVLPQNLDGTFITLPFKDRLIASRFAGELLPALGKTVFMGTTSAFRVSREHQVVDEHSEIDPDNARNQAESELLAAGCVGMHSAGIYGPDRSPLNWIKSGRVTANDRFVNFIHVEDLAKVLYGAMRLGKPGARYIASDGRPMRWSDIVHRLEELYGIESKPAQPGRRPSKRIDPTRTLTALGVELTYRDVIEGIRADHEKQLSA